MHIAWYAGTLGLVLIAGLLRLEAPMHGDPALFLSYAMRFDEGARLYIDLWDVKPPGVFAFYYLGGSLFGFTDFGIHFFELLWMGVLAFALLAGVGPHLRQPWLAAVAPLVAIGAYYALSSTEEQTQVEALVNLPMLVSALMLAQACRSPANRPWLALLAGLAAAVATLFKVIFAPIFIVFVLVASVATAWAAADRPFREVVVRLWIPFTAGVAAIWGLAIGVFVALGTAQEMLWTVFGYPLAALAGVERAPFKQVIINIRLFMGQFAPWLVFVAAALPLLWRRRSALICKLAWAWLIVGLVVILLQRTSWWYYHFMLLLTPIGILAAFGIDRCVSFFRTRARLAPAATMGLACLLVLPAVGSFAGAMGSLANFLYPPLILKSKPIDSFKEKLGDYADAAKAAAFVRNRPEPGPVMVFETPLVNLLSHRVQATPVAGFIWSWVLPRQRDENIEMLNAAPPPFIFLGNNYKERVERLSPAVSELLANRYQLAWESSFGRWYAHKTTD